MRSAFKFFSLTYMVSWALWAGAAAILTRTGALASGPGGLLFLPGTIAPALVAIALTTRTEGPAGRSALLSRIAAFPTGARWYIFAASYMALVKVVVALLHRLGAGSWPSFGEEPLLLLVLALVISTPVQAGEEIGWRGYALPHLAARFGLSGASTIVGVLWASWHLPLFFVPGSDNEGQSFPLYILAVTALSVAMGWLYWRTRGSLLITMLMHAAVNNTSGVVRSPASVGTNPFSVTPPLTAWLTVAVLWVGAAYFMAAMRGAKLESGS